MIVGLRLLHARGVDQLQASLHILKLCVRGDELVLMIELGQLKLGLGLEQPRLFNINGGAVCVRPQRDRDTHGDHQRITTCVGDVVLFADQGPLRAQNKGRALLKLGLPSLVLLGFE